MCFILNKKNSSIEDKFDILLSTFEHKINRKLVRKNSKFMVLKFRNNWFYLDNELVLNICVNLTVEDKLHKYFNDIKDLKIQTLNKSTEEINKEKFNYFNSFPTEKIIEIIINYTIGLYHINFISFKPIKIEHHAEILGFKCGHINNITYDILFNVQLDKKPISRKIYFTTNYVFNIDKTYSIIDKSTFGHLLFEEY